MEKSELLREIAIAMVEFKLEKEINSPLVGSSISLFYKHPETKRELSILSEFAIDDLTQHLLNMTFEFSIVLPIETELYKLLYGSDIITNKFYLNTYFNGEEFVENVKLLMSSTQLNANNSTKAILEIAYSENVSRALKTFKEIKLNADENLDR
jgi:hypothetical protein